MVTRNATKTNQRKGFTRTLRGKKYIVSVSRDRIVLSNGVWKKSMPVGDEHGLVYKLQKTQIKSDGGVDALYKFLNESIDIKSALSMHADRVFDHVRQYGRDEL